AKIFIVKPFTAYPVSAAYEGRFRPFHCPPNKAFEKTKTSHVYKFGHRKANNPQYQDVLGGQRKILRLIAILASCRMWKREVTGFSRVAGRNFYSSKPCTHILNP
ncbi:hypothetical protein Tcan_01031, partial [Toxocara canis]